MASSENLWQYSKVHSSACKGMTFEDNEARRAPFTKEQRKKQQNPEFCLERAWQECDYGTIVAVADKIPNNVLEEDPKLLMWYDQVVTRMGGA